MLFLFSKACSHSSCVFRSKFNRFFGNGKANWKIRTKYNLLCASRQKSNLLIYRGFITLDHVSINTSRMANTRSSVEWWGSIHHAMSRWGAGLETRGVVDENTIILEVYRLFPFCCLSALWLVSSAAFPQHWRHGMTLASVQSWQPCTQMDLDTDDVSVNMTKIRTIEEITPPFIINIIPEGIYKCWTLQVHVFLKSSAATELVALHYCSHVKKVKTK